MGKLFGWHVGRMLKMKDGQRFRKPSPATVAFGSEEVCEICTKPVEKKLRTEKRVAKMMKPAIATGVNQRKGYDFDRLYENADECCEVAIVSMSG